MSKNPNLTYRLPMFPSPLVSMESTPFLSTFARIVHHPLESQCFVQPAPPQKPGRPKGSKENPAPASGFKNSSIWRVGRPCGSGYKQVAAARAAERAALGLVQTPTSKNDLLGGQGRSRKRWMARCVDWIPNLCMYIHPSFHLQVSTASHWWLGHARYATHSKGY